MHLLLLPATAYIFLVDSFFAKTELPNKSLSAFLDDLSMFLAKVLYDCILIASEMVLSPR